jgi:hypothetical protein
MGAPNSPFVPEFLSEYLFLPVPYYVLLVAEMQKRLPAGFALNRLLTWIIRLIFLKKKYHRNVVSTIFCAVAMNLNFNWIASARLDTVKSTIFPVSAWRFDKYRDRFVLESK